MRDGLQKRDQLIEVKSRGASDMHMKHFFKHAYETFFLNMHIHSFFKYEYNFFKCKRAFTFFFKYAYYHFFKDACKKIF